VGAQTHPDSELAVEVIVADAAWRQAVDEAEAVCREAATAAFAAGGARGAAAVCVALADDDTLRDLNCRFRGLDRPTNVLAFPAGPALGVYEPEPEPESEPDAERAGEAAGDREPRSLGDVAIARQSLQREARAAGVAAADHLRHLTVHGMLHLMGHDHETQEEAEAMEGLETRILSTLGVADPYRSAPASGE
jgi:probable rRNA maturation factor